MMNKQPSVLAYQRLARKLIARKLIARKLIARKEIAHQGLTDKPSVNMLRALLPRQMSKISLGRAKYTRALLLAMLLLSGATSVSAGDKIRIYAASSMTNVVQDMLNTYRQQTGDQVTAIFAGSSSLARQIEQGAPADLFISANQKWVEYLIDKQLAAKKDSGVMATNQLVLITRKDQPVARFDLSNKAAWLAALQDERLAIGIPTAVPAGIYAKQSLSALGVWASIERRTAPAKNVRSALALVERGEAALGIVYRTDALLSDRVDLLATFADDSHTPIAYATLKLNDKPSTARLSRFIHGPTAAKILTGYGFQ
jgi:molybdate transport system substrate-binding protein